MKNKNCEFKLFYDNYIFLRQGKGGIKRYFENLLIHSNRKINLNNEYIVYSNNLGSLKSIKSLLYSYIKPLIYQFSNNKNKLIYHGTYYLNPFLSIYKFKKIITIHDLIPEMEFNRANFFCRFKNKLIKLARKFSIYNSDYVITPSETTKKDLIKFFPKLKEKNITVINHGIDHFSDQACEIKAINQLRDIDFFLYVGSRAYYKGFFDLLNAFSIFNKKYPNIKLVCTGSKFSRFEIDYISEVNLCLSDLICINPSNGELKFLYKSSKAFIYPSRYEGFGFPPLEALVSGCKNVICSSIPSTREICGNSVNYFQVGCKESLVNLLINSIYINGNIDSKKIDKFIKKYSWEKSFLKHYNLYSYV